MRENTTTEPQKNDLLNTFSDEHVGKAVIDSYGRTVGRIIIVSSNPQKNKFFSIEMDNGGLVKCIDADLHITQNAIILDNSWKTKVESITNELTLVDKRIIALNQIEKEPETSDIYDNLCKESENHKKGLLEKRRALLDEIKERMNTINSQLKETYNLDVQITISHQVDEIRDETYQTSHASLKSIVNRLTSEENDLKSSLNMLTESLSALPPESLKLLPPSIPSQSSVLRIKMKDQ
jgi:hypothetical protein